MDDNDDDCDVGPNDETELDKDEIVPTENNEDFSFSPEKVVEENQNRLCVMCNTTRVPDPWNLQCRECWLKDPI